MVTLVAASASVSPLYTAIAIVERRFQRGCQIGFGGFGPGIALLLLAIGVTAQRKLHIGNMSDDLAVGSFRSDWL